MIRPALPNRDVTDKRFTDPMREIAEVIIGSGCDRLILSCGHEVVRDHKPRWGRRTRCHGCRVFESLKSGKEKNS